MEQFVAPARDATVFTNTVGQQINDSNFRRDVWTKAKQAVFEQDDPLRRVRRHDLRHSAVTTWLNAGVPLKTAQRWSGHRTVSVLLDTYLGVMRGDEALAIERLQAALADRQAVTGS
jgi:integrase